MKTNLKISNPLRLGILKNVVLIFLFFQSFSLMSQHHHGSSDYFIQPLSKEIAIDTINQNFWVKFKIYFADTVNTDSMAISITLPQIRDVYLEFDYFTSTTYQFSNQTYYKGDSICDSIQVAFSKNNIPFYQQTLKIALHHTAHDEIINSETLKVYFTPYRTIEIWNTDDFDKLKRIWDTPIEGMDSSRQFVSKDSLPICNIPDSVFFNDSLPVAYASHPALPYLIPMQWQDDSDERNSSTGSTKRSNGCGSNKKRWKGTISGRIETEVISDLSQNGRVVIPVAGIRVKIMEKDGGLNTDDQLGVCYTDMNGDFSYYVDECQRYTNCVGSNCEGNALEIYLIIESRNEDETVKVRHRYGGTRQTTVNKSNVWHWNYNDGNNSNLTLGIIRPSKEIKPQLLHWGHISRQFVNSAEGFLPFGLTLGSKKQQLDIMIHPFGKGQGGMFIPATYKQDAIIVTHAILSVLDLPFWQNRFSTDDGIYIGEESENNEDLFFHEFGHYVMWWLQGKSWQNPLEASFADHGDNYNAKNPALAWNEGWATGFGSIVDLRYRAYDNEAGNYSFSHNVEIRTFGVDLINNIMENVRRGSTTAQENTVTHGFVSEGNIGSLIYDLYDGPTRIGRHGTWTDPVIIVETHNDGGDDNVSLSLTQIARPLFNNQGWGMNSNNVISNVTEYAKELVEILDCEQRRLIPALFEINMISSFDEPVTQFVSTDKISFNLAIDHPTFKWKDKDDLFKFKGNETNGYQVDLRVINLPQTDFNLAFTPQETNAHVSDPLIVTNSRFFYFNGNVSSNLVAQNGSNPQSGSRLGAYVSSNIEVNDGATIEIGSTSNQTFSDVRFCSGSSLTLRTLNSNNPNIIINNNSSLTIEPGATLIIHPGAQIILNGPNAVLHIKGKIILEIDAEFNPIAGANGFGQLIVENHTGEFQIESKGNNKIIIDPITKPTINTQYNLIVIGEKGLHTGETYQISEFRINNANVLIKDNSLITSKAFRFNVFNSNIYGEQNLNSKGLLAFESLCNINNCRFEYLNSAFTYFLLNGIYAQQEIRNSQFIKCKTSINMNGANVKVKNCLFNWFGRYGDIGIRSLSSGGGDVFLDNTFQLPSNPFNNNISKSLQYVGKDAKIYRNIFVDGNVAIDNKDGNLFLECNNFQSWTFRELSHNAINSKNGALYLNTGRNLFAHYKTYLNTNNSRLFLNNGSNLFLLGNPSQYFFKCDLEYRSAVNNIQLSSNHTVSPASYNTYAFLATGNYWRESYPALPSHFRPIPATSNPNMNFGFLSGTNYDLGYLPAMTTSSNYIEVQNSYCSPKYTDIELQRPFGDINDILYMDRIPSELTLPTSNPIKPNSINDNLYLDALVSSFEKANQDTVNYFEVMPEIIYLTKLKLPDTLSDFSYFTYNLIHRIYHHSLYDSTKSDSVLNIHKSELGNLLLSAQDSFILKSFSNDSFWLSLRYELLRDKAEVLRILNRRTEAITLLDSAIVDPEISNLKKSHATTWRCFINQEQQFLDSQIEVSELNFSLCLPEDSIFIHNPYTIVALDTSFTICIPDTSNIQSVSIKYTPIDTILPYTMYDEFLDTFPLTTTHEYDLTVGKYTLTAVDTINNIFFSTSINIEGIEEEVIDSTESYYIDCETAYLPYNVSSDSTRVYNQWNVLQDSVLFNYYELDGVNNEYRVEYKNTSTCKILKTRLDIDDILTAPPSTPNTLLLAKYDRTVDSCAFVKLNNITCNGDSIDFGKTLEIYDENLQYQFTTSVELYGTQTKGFKFCPPYWNTDEEHIANWNALIYKIGVCNYCRIDFKADSFINFPKVLSVQENETKPNITLYPNPSNNEINILIINTNQDKIDIEVYDNMGRLIERKESYLDNNLVKISVQHYSDGVYFIKIPLLNYNGKIMVLK